MRSLALLGTFLMAIGASAQTLAEHAAAASGATIGTAAGKPLSNAISTIFGKADSTTKKAATTTVESKSTKSTSAPVVSVPVMPAAGADQPPISEPAPSRHGGFAKRPAVAEYPSVIAPPPVPEVQEPPRKEPTAEELASIQVGLSEQELFTALGQPESKVSIPDDDGHLLVICQYWAKGRQLGTVHLDNGQVVSVARVQN